MSTPYEVLGVAQNADAATIKAAYRALAQKNHPDKGGSQAIMQSIQHAYDVLSNPQRRLQFDTEGSEKRAPSVEDRALSMLSSLMTAVFTLLEKEGKDAAHYDLVQLARDNLHATIDQGAKVQAKLARALEQREVALERMVLIDPAMPNHMRLILEGHMDGLRQTQAGNATEIATWRAMLDLLSGYDYKVEPEPKRAVRVTDEEIHQAMRNSMGTTRFWSGLGV